MWSYRKAAELYAQQQNMLQPIKKALVVGVELKFLPYHPTRHLGRVYQVDATACQLTLAARSIVLSVTDVFSGQEAEQEMPDRFHLIRHLRLR